MLRFYTFTGLLLFVLMIQEPLSMPLEASATDSLSREKASDTTRPAVPIPPEVINPDYKALLDDENMLDMSGRCLHELLDIIGEPRFLLRQGHRDADRSKEIWILHIYKKDSTGLYLFFEDGKIADWQLDTFMGIGNHSHLLEWFK